LGGGGLREKEKIGEFGKCFIFNKIKNKKTTKIVFSYQQKTFLGLTKVLQQSKHLKMFKMFSRKYFTTK
jgi:hypothetical protein